jgi:hypothetical protein
MFFHIFIRVIYMASPPPGITLATMQPMNGSSQRMAAINNQNASNNYQNNLINATGGKRKYKGGFSYPQNKTMYQEVGGDGQTTSSISNKLAVAQSQNHANGVFDADAQQGGRRRKKTRRQDRGGHRRSRNRNRNRSRRRRRNSRHN